MRPHPPVPRRVPVLDLAAPARRQHVQGRRAGAAGAPHRAARSRTCGRPGRRPGRGGAAAETRRELGRCLAELPPAQAKVVVAQGRFRPRFAEISAATRAARRDGEVLRAPRPGARLRERLSGMTSLVARSGGRSRRSSRTASRSCSSTRCSSSMPGERVVAPQDGTERRLRRPLSGQPDHARREDGRGDRPVRRGRGPLAAREPRQARVLRGHRRRALQADRRPGDVLTSTARSRRVRGPIGKGQGAARRSAASSPCAATLTFAVSRNDRRARTAGRSRSPASAATCPSGC